MSGLPITCSICQRNSLDSAVIHKLVTYVFVVPDSWLRFWNKNYRLSVSISMFMHVHGYVYVMLF